MTADPGAGDRVPGLTDRHHECGVLDRFVAGVRSGESRALVVRGEPGVGKTVLLDYLAERAQGCRVARAAGVQSEMELAFAGLHQLCAPMLDHVGALPGPQREALRTAFGLSSAPPLSIAVISSNNCATSVVSAGVPVMVISFPRTWISASRELSITCSNSSCDPSRPTMEWSSGITTLT